jgi:hypothetical protein
MANGGTTVGMEPAAIGAIHGAGEVRDAPPPPLAWTAPSSSVWSGLSILLAFVAACLMLLLYCLLTGLQDRLGRLRPRRSSNPTGASSASGSRAPRSRWRR